MKIFYKLLFSLYERSRIRECIHELNLKPILTKFEGYSIFHLERKGLTEYPALVCIHGFLDSCYGFRKLIKHLRYPGRILIPDLPGYGRSQLPKMGYLYQIDIFTDLLQEWLSTVSSSDPGVILCGHSMGGLIVQKLALNATPNLCYRIVKLILLAPGGVPHPRRDEMRSILFPRSPQDIDSLLEHLYYSEIPQPSPVQKRILLNEWNGQRNHWLAENTIRKEAVVFHGEKARAISHPTMIVAGAEDELIPPAMMKSLQRWIRGSQLHILERTKHALHNEKPKQVAQLIQNFLGD